MEMNKDPENPLGMVPDPISGETFVFPPTKCTHERKQFFMRINEIHALLFITKHAYDETNKIYQQRIVGLHERENTSIKIELNTGHSLMFPAGQILKLTGDGINVLTRQTFVMLYGSFETYLFQLFENSFAVIGVGEDKAMDQAIEILMGGKWDSKFNKMSSVFGLDFKAGNLNKQFSGFELDFGGTIYKNPLLFMDELAKVRHRIVHASSILEKDQLISIGMEMFHGLYAVYFLLTDFVDSLFEKRFGYQRSEINPAVA
jgi:hypothetical protein